MGALLAFPAWFNPWGWLAIVIVIILLLALIIAILLKKNKHASGEVETVEVIETQPEKDANSKNTQKKESDMAKETKETKETKEAKQAKTSASKTYHISKRKEDGRWQVKAAGGEKALKLFLTQAEAIDYAKKVAGNQEANIMIHKEDGSFRKLKY